MIAGGKLIINAILVYLLLTKIPLIARLDSFQKGVSNNLNKGKTIYFCECGNLKGYGEPTKRLMS